MPVTHVSPQDLYAPLIWRLQKLGFFPAYTDSADIRRFCLPPGFYLDLPLSASTGRKAKILVEQAEAACAALEGTGAEDPPLSEKAEQIRARWGAATSGPWERISLPGEDGYATTDVCQAQSEAAEAEPAFIARVNTDRDADAIAAAPYDVTFLLQENQRLAGLVACYRHLLQRSLRPHDEVSDV